MKNEEFYINGLITAETLGEICRALGESFIVCTGHEGIIFKRSSV